MGNSNSTLGYLLLALAVLALFGIDIVLFLEALKGNIFAGLIMLGSVVILVVFLVKGGYLKKDTPQ